MWSRLPYVLASETEGVELQSSENAVDGSLTQRFQLESSSFPGTWWQTFEEVGFALKLCLTVGC